MAKNEEIKNVSKKHYVKSKKDKDQQKILIIGSIAAVSLALLVIIYGILDQTVFTKYKAVAIVNNEKITANEFIELSSYSRYQMKEQYNYDAYIYQLLGEDPSVGGSFASDMRDIINQLSPANKVVFGQQIIDTMINNKLVEQQAKEMGLTASEAEINARIEKVFQYNIKEEATATPFPTLVPTSTLSSEQLALVTLTPTPTQEATTTEMTATPTQEATLVEEDVQPTDEPTPLPTPTEYTYEGFQTQYQDFMNTLGEYGISEGFFRELVRLEIIREKVQTEVTKDVSALQDQAWARHILVADKTIADVLYQRLTSGGEDFAAVAAEASIDTGNSSNGGDLGWFPRDAMVPEFGTAVFDQLKVGEISEPVETQFGYHIIQKLGEEQRSVSESQYQTLVSAVYASWLAGVKENAEINTKDLWMEIVPTDITISDQEIPASILSTMN